MNIYYYQELEVQANSLGVASRYLSKMVGYPVSKDKITSNAPIKPSRPTKQALLNLANGIADFNYVKASNRVIEGISTGNDFTWYDLKLLVSRAADKGIILEIEPDEYHDLYNLVVIS